MTAPLLFIAADRRECEPWVRKWQSVSQSDLPVHWARAGVWKGRAVLAIANGIGTARARAAINAAPRPAALCSIGTCGALDAALAVAEVFVATSVIYKNEPYIAGDPKGPPSRSGAVLCAPKIVAKASERKVLRMGGASVVEMEAGEVAAASIELEIPFYCVKAVSDLADESFANNFEMCTNHQGQIKIPRLIVHALARPSTRIGELMRLQRHNKMAAKQLGEFLDHCAF